MAEHRVGDVRPTQLLHTYGVGAMVDLPNIAAMVMGLDDWKLQYATPVGEERLLAAVRGQLGGQVERLMLPPVDLDESARDPLNGPRIGVPVAAFPQWYRCPWCDLVAPLSSGLFELQADPYRPDRVRYRHSACNKSQTPPTVLPTRFQLACKHGHVDDFPWLRFVHSGDKNCNGPLRLRKFGVGDEAANLFVHCDSCGDTRSLVDAFGDAARTDPLFACRGRRPHLRDFEAGCGEQAETMLLGASNSWFGITLSALSIPRHVDPLPQLVEDKWVTLQHVASPEVLAAFRAVGNLRGFEEYDDTKVWQAIQAKRAGTVASTETADLKEPEWQVFSSPNPSLNTIDFELTPVAAPVGFEPFFEKVVRVERLREVRALVGFTRIDSPGDYADPADIPPELRAPLSRNAPTWVPVSEVRGEGVFLQFKRSALLAWEQKVAARDAELRAAHGAWKTARAMASPSEGYPGIRYALMHSFSHALMRQLALESGYSSASIRERVYCDAGTGGAPMAGLLLYTAAPDSEGTLGGLVSQGDPQKLGRLIRQALDAMQLCTSDPLCAEHHPGSDGTASLHGAACHACLFAPETSCERGNKYLDRALLVRTLGSSVTPFFE
jgi:hypothetical protein